MHLSTITLAFLGITYQQVSLSESDNSLSCTPGETLTLRVASNATTGYLWYLEVQEGALGLLLNGDTGDYVEESRDDGMVGVGGYQDFNIQCSGNALPGDIYTFSVLHKRPWEDSPIDSRSVTITVKSS